MIAKSLKLKNFRNYKEQTVEFCDGVNVFYGHNAQGKTNILEAVNFFSGLKSHRGAKDKDLISFESEKASLCLEFLSQERNMNAEIDIFSGKRKKLLINGVNKNRFSDLAGFFNTVLFCPEDLYLIKGGPKERRRLIDSSISPIKPKYLKLISDYGKVLDNKNKLLKEDNSSDEMILLWNEKLCELGAKIVLYRRSYVNALKPVIKAFHKKITDGEEISINYKTVCEFEEENEIRDFLIKKTTENLQKEKIVGSSLYGPHRDDLEFFINGKEASSFASQGQQRTIVLGLKLSQIEIIRQNTGEYPVLLLDDVLSELDKKRREYLLEKIDKHQVFITCTDSDLAKKVQSENKKFFKVENGCVYCE